MHIKDVTEQCTHVELNRTNAFYIFVSDVCTYPIHQTVNGRVVFFFIVNFLNGLKSEILSVFRIHNALRKFPREFQMSVYTIYIRNDRSSAVD